MNGSVYTLIIVYAVLIMPCALLFTKLRTSAAVRVLMVILLPLTIIPIRMGIISLQGYPSLQDLPNEFEIVSHYVIFPGNKDNARGAIYLWILPTPVKGDSGGLLSVFRYKNTGQDPRAHSLPYSAELLKQVEEHEKARKEGKKARVKVKTINKNKDDSRKNQGGKRGQGQGEKSGKGKKSKKGEQGKKGQKGKNGDQGEGNSSSRGGKLMNNASKSNPAGEGAAGEFSSGAGSASGPEEKIKSLLEDIESSLDEGIAAIKDRNFSRINKSSRELGKSAEDIKDLARNMPSGTKDDLNELADLLKDTTEALDRLNYMITQKAPRDDALDKLKKAKGIIGEMERKKSEKKKSPDKSSSPSRYGEENFSGQGKGKEVRVDDSILEFYVVPNRLKHRLPPKD